MRSERVVAVKNCVRERSAMCSQELIRERGGTISNLVRKRRENKGKTAPGIKELQVYYCDDAWQ
jgi:hypothetical protein